jgi:hypothetical protein
VPSSAEHCQACTFNNVDAADSPDIVALENRSVVGHLISIEEGDSEPDALALPPSQSSLSSERILAAHACASTIRREECPKYRCVYLCDLASGLPRAVVVSRNDT